MSDSMRVDDETVESLVEKEIIEEGEYEGSNSEGLPVCMDFRLMSAFPELRDEMTAYLVAEVDDAIPNNYEVHAVEGVPTGGNPPSTRIADEMALPDGYVRESEKEYGQGRQFEGWQPPAVRGEGENQANPEFHNGENVLLVDDVTTTGGSLVEAARSLEAADANVDYVATYGFNDYGEESADDVLTERGIELITLGRASDFREFL